MMTQPPLKGRATRAQPHNRFAKQHVEAEVDDWYQEQATLAPLQTSVTVQQTRQIISRNQSPDIPFRQSINPYQGCEHGCIYCYARPSHAYLELSAGLDFETKLFVKPDAAQHLRTELSAKNYQVAIINIGANTDPYQPIEREWQVTRQLLAVCVETKHPVVLITKNSLILRDVDLLTELAQQQLVKVFISVTSLDHTLSQVMEPRASAPHRRLLTIERLASANIPVGVMVAPIIPFLNDHELEAVMAATADAGAQDATYMLLRLPHELERLFSTWLQQHYPLKAARILAAIKQMREGQLNSTRFGERMQGTGVLAQLLQQRFALACKKYQLGTHAAHLRTDLFCPPTRDGQLSLF
ncbi:PA0069 family radical SAM protein [Agitococcus lubricus]|uniref:DNA repair photolyase n=1 Tax=Agitococcus lubricus TaxID=1077255 RepID=A0A2T5J3Z7_9GAMM|nr:PA0069 family radical SAM protein [Agitococcus lubricus]PTQ91223.1 DNA repair photolyase [Agitococcus lubricus]